MHPPQQTYSIGHPMQRPPLCAQPTHTHIIGCNGQEDHTEKGQYANGYIRTLDYILNDLRGLSNIQYQPNKQM